MEATRTGEPEIVVGGHMKHFPKVNRTETYRLVDEETWLSKEQLIQLADYFLVCVWDKLYRRGLLAEPAIRFDEELSYGEDTIFAHQCILAAANIKGIPLSGYIHVAIEGSAIDRYHAKTYTAYSKILALRYQLMKRTNMSEASIEIARRRYKYGAVNRSIINLFLPGCPFTFCEKVREVRRIMFDDPDMPAVMAREDRWGHAFFNRVCDAVYDLHSPLAMALVYQLLFPLISFYRNDISIRLRR